jgi:hypothetical protein
MESYSNQSFFQKLKTIFMKKLRLFKAWQSFDKKLVFFLIFIEIKLTKFELIYN